MMLDQADLDFVCQARAEGCDSCLQKGNVAPICALALALGSIHSISV